MPVDLPPLPGSSSPSDEKAPHSFWTRLRHRLVGRPRDLADRRIFHHLSLIPFLAWVGLGADGLSSSAYGPEEAFRTLGEDTYLAVALAMMMGVTVLVISSAYSKIIEQFPHGGGGYVVATKLLGPRVGVYSGCALLVDYILTITVSIAAAGDAIFSLLPAEWHVGKLAFEAACILGLMTLNIRGVRESVLVLTPIFILFLLMHTVLIGGGILSHVAAMPQMAESVGRGFQGGMTTMGLGGMLLLFVHAYSLGGGTYTGIEAVSNGLPIMREPRVQTAKRTMTYMAFSLAFTASGLLLCYLLWGVRPEEYRTLNAVLAGKFFGEGTFGYGLVILTLVSEGILLVVAAQAGFLDGPRVLANMAVDSWAPRRFAALSDRLTTQNGIVLMAGSSLAALLYTGGQVRQLVVMYSINVFVTFSLSMLGMLLWWVRKGFERSRGATATPAAQDEHGGVETRFWKRRVALFGLGFVLCATILIITILEKFLVGGWLTLAVTTGFVVLCFVIRGHYDTLGARVAELNKDLSPIEKLIAKDEVCGKSLDPSQPTAVVLVSSYGGLGIHTILHILRAFPHHFRNLMFLSVGVIDSGRFKGIEGIDALRAETKSMLEKYIDLARKLGVPAGYRMAIGTEVVIEAEQLCVAVSREYSRCVFFTGQVVFRREKWYHRLLHNQTAFAIQKRLQWDDLTMVILPVRLRQ